MAPDFLRPASRRVVSFQDHLRKHQELPLREPGEVEIPAHHLDPPAIDASADTDPSLSPPNLTHHRRRL
jgi:hypothetical protein